MSPPFTAPWLLAPMEGVTEPCFRGMLLARNPASCLGGAFTEFVRVVDHAVPRRILSRHLGDERFDAPVGLQLMGIHDDMLAATAARAVEAGAPLIDLNFGCPARGALKGCAGSALLDRPRRVQELVEACVGGAAGRVPVTAKIRAGIEDDAGIEQLAAAAEAGGAALLTVHCRTRREGYCERVDWTRIRRAVDAVGIPVCGNGGVREHADLERMRRETGCAMVMVGHAALANPWFFCDRAVPDEEACSFLVEYAARLATDRRSSPRGAAARVKQLLSHWARGPLLPGAPLRDWLRIREAKTLLDAIDEWPLAMAS